ncbi:MAG: DUF771 domain-containing protein [Lacticaseibacillus songhuajiangensis]|jgi:hypothetical protein|nr:DUF771 domain-containing protein [Lacticaseibacillus songhuajiangensis]
MFVPLSIVIKETGRSRPWFVGNASQHREGALNHYRDELETTVVQYPQSERGRWYVNLDRMKQWMEIHGGERF